MMASPDLSASAADVRVVLVGNYEYDRQQSMQRFMQLLASELPRHGVSVQVCSPTPFFGTLKPAAAGLGKWLGYLDKFVLFPFVLTRTVARGKATVVHICDHSNALYTRYLSNVPNVVTCHDLLAVRQARGEFAGVRISMTGRKLQQMIVQGLRRARRIVCVSSATAADARRIAGKGAVIDVILNGLNYPYRPMPSKMARERLARLLSLHGHDGAVCTYLLHVGANHWYKNRMGVLKIYAALRRQWIGEAAPPRLVMVGAPLTAEMEAFVQTHPQWAADVLVLTDVRANEDLRALYSAAEVLLFPSLEEGFGWPVSEAQACGCRVVTTGKSPMTEVGGAAAVYLPSELVDGSTSEGFAAAAESVCALLRESESARQERIEAALANAERFSSEAMIRRYVEVYREVASGNSDGSAAVSETAELSASAKHS